MVDIEDVAFFISSDMHIGNKRFAIFHIDIGVGDAGIASPQRLDFGTGENDSCRHERIEYIAGLVVSTIVLVLAVELFRDSLTKVISHEAVDYDLAAVIVLGVAVLIKLLQSYVNRGMGKAISSEALKATALDSFTDAIATCAIMNVPGSLIRRVISLLN